MGFSVDITQEVELICLCIIGSANMPGHHATKEEWLESSYSKFNALKEFKFMKDLEDMERNLPITKDEERDEMD